MKEKKESVLLELLYLASSIVMLALLIFILYHSLDYLNQNFPLEENIKTISFYLTLIIALVTVQAQWIEGRIKAIIKSVNTINRRYKTWQKTKHILK